jgi:hypothetical protein
MPVGFGYIRDEQPAIVDWSAITREARETIKGIEADRQAKREGVDQAIRDQSEALLNRPKSQNTEYNAAMSNMTAQIEATMLQNYNDLRLGNINLNQFNATKNTMMSETKGVLAIAKVYADQYDANVEGAQNGTLSGFSNWTNAMTQEMMDFQGVETFVGPNGKISFVKKKEDGTTETLDTSELFTLANMKQQKFDMKAAIDNAKEEGGFTYVNNLGEKTQGYFIDPTSGEINTEAITKSAASMVAQDSNAYGILYDYIGGYDFKRLSDDFFAEHQTGEEQKKALEQLQKENKNVIYINSNGMPIVSKEQRDVAQKYVQEQLEQVAVTSKQEAGFLAEEITQAKLNELNQSIEKSKADQKFIEARTNSEEVKTTEEFKVKLPKIQTYLTDQLKQPIIDAVAKGRAVDAQGNRTLDLTDADNQVAKTLKKLLSSMDVSADSASFLKQAVKLRLPKEGGGFKSETIGLAGKDGLDIFEDVLELLLLLPEENLDKFYTRVVDVNRDGKIDVVEKGELDE